MDDYTYNNWVKIKKVMEESGNTENQFYCRACEIIKTRQDPIEKLWKSLDNFK